MRDFVAHPYQDHMIDWVVENERCGLFAFMGAGKTVSVLTALDRLALVEDPYPVLVLATKRVARDTWSTEAAKWKHLSHLRVAKILGNESERLRGLRLAQRGAAEVFTMNYENLPWLVGLAGKRWPFRTVIADESTKLKSFRLRKGSLRAKALAQVAHTQVTRFVNLTGYPAPNGLQDLWGQSWYLDKGAALGRTYGDFTGRWFNTPPMGRPEPKSHAEGAIHAAIEHLYLTIDAKEWFDLADPIVENVYVDLDPKARKLYDEMLDEMYIELDNDAKDGIEAFNAASRTTKCLQIANGAIYTDDRHSYHVIHDEKLDALDDIIEEANGTPVLVAYQYQSDLQRIIQRFPDAKVLSKAKDLDEFKTGAHRIGVGHPASIGHGIDGLQYATNILVYFGHWWNAEERAQILERIGPVRQRQAGLDRPVFVYNIVARDTLDESVIEAYEGKLGVNQALFQAMKKRR